MLHHTKTSRRVSFNPRVIGVTHIHINNMSQKEKRACWYSRAELKSQCVADRKTLKMVKENPLMAEGNDEFCIRGLESSWSGPSQRFYREMSREVVLEEQMLQFHLGIVNETVLSMKYREYTRHPQWNAYFQGIEDQKAVIAIANESGEDDDFDDDASTSSIDTTCAITKDETIFTDRRNKSEGDLLRHGSQDLPPQPPARRTCPLPSAA